jgi:hypothetical protein
MTVAVAVLLMSLPVTTAHLLLEAQVAVGPQATRVIKKPELPKALITNMEAHKLGTVAPTTAALQVAVEDSMVMEQEVGEASALLTGLGVAQGHLEATEASEAAAAVDRPTELEVAEATQVETHRHGQTQLRVAALTFQGRISTNKPSTAAAMAKLASNGYDNHFSTNRSFIIY